jgi:transposase-like protein
MRKRSFHEPCPSRRYPLAAQACGLHSLAAFAAGPWGTQYPTIVAAWERAWEHVMPFFIFPPDIRYPSGEHTLSRISIR